MNTAPKPNLRISAKFLGPVISLEGELASKSRNLIFARNGTGKSFLSRAFRCLDLHVQEKSLLGAPRDLVSDESADGKGEFSFARGETHLGSLKLDKDGDSVIANVNETIFHVFSEDFVHEELREQQYKLNGEIENEIAVDSTNIKLKEAGSSLSEAERKADAAYLGLGLQLELKKNTELVDKAAIKKTLKEYINLSLDALLFTFPKKPAAPERSCADIQKDLVTLKSIPSTPNSPQPVEPPHLFSLDLEHVSELQERITSPSSVSAAIKLKINKHPDFFRTGTAISSEGHGSCPFCEQSLSAPEPKAIIDAYVQYFAGAEEHHKGQLRAVYETLNRIDASVSNLEKQLLLQKAHYDDLNRYFPSRKDEQLEGFESAISAARGAIQDLKRDLEKKAAALAIPGPIPSNVLLVHLASINELIKQNNAYAAALNQAVHNSENERKRLQREACASFAVEFAISVWSEIEALYAARAAVIACKDAVLEIEKLSPTGSAKSRVADTFEMLLKEFFSTKYVFDKASFTLKREDREMARGVHRTMSDGEKSAIAFCYFVASIHLKVRANGDYRKLFLVFDDPVTSMSYDYVFAIAQTLRNLAISDKGEISLAANRGGAQHFGPDLLILTHSSYLFNISVSNHVVDSHAAFALHLDATTHKLASLKRYIAPFNEHLRDVWEISNGTRTPDHTTGNAIRSVLEAVGRFCRPDKSKDLTTFVEHLTNDCGFTVKSVLINSMSHGTYYDEIPSPDDLKVACAEAIKIVETFAAGQIELLKAA